MITMSLGEVADVVGGVVLGDPSLQVTGPAFVDSRTAEDGGLFVAVPGERVDGHDYVDRALAGGAVGYLGSRRVDAPGVVVGDPVPALGRLARHVLDSVPGLTVLALTGSQGKTGTKDYLAQVLEEAGPTVATAGNYNNEIGVPLTVLRVRPDTEYLVVEMGARGTGHVAQLCRTAPPHVASVLNVGTAHVGEFGSRDAIARAKGEIIEALPPSGTAVLSSDDPLTATMGERTQATVLTFGRAGDVHWEGLEFDELGRARFDLVRGPDTAPVRLGQSGTHQVLNAAAAAAMALAVGRPLPQVADALSRSELRSPWRMEVTTRSDGLVVVNDAYNANPDSMVAALDALAAIGAHRPGRTVAVLGEMRELGEEERDAHRLVGRHAATVGVDLLVTVGETAALIAEAAAEVPGWSGEAIITASREQALERVVENVSAADAVLVKASRGAALEHVAQGLSQEGESAR